MRLFTAVTLDVCARDEMAGIIGRLRTVGSIARTIKWVDPDKLHATLQFLGDADPQSVPALADALKTAGRLPSFRVSFGDVEVFPGRGRPRVVWVGVRDNTADLETLRDVVQTRLTPLGHVPESRPFRPHVTLGRVRRSGSVSRRALSDALRDIEAPASVWTIDRVGLFESRLSGAGPTYRVLAQTPLRG